MSVLQSALLRSSPRSSLDCGQASGAPIKALSSTCKGSSSARRGSTLAHVLSQHRLAPSSSSRSSSSSSRAAGVACKAAAYSSFSSWSSMDSGDESDDYNGRLPPGQKLFVQGVVDYYAVLQVDDDAPTEEIKKAYRSLAKTCHPDFLGDEGHDICVLLNEAYQVLSDPSSRQKYNARLEQALKDDEDDYTGKPLSKWMPTLKPSMAKNTDPAENRAVFVDEFSCIGCKQCIFHACATFRLENEHGRSRAYAQWLDTEDNIQAAIDSCPVSCIHWVTKDDLPPLEYVMQKRMTQRTNVGIMAAGIGATADVWAATDQFLKERRRLQEAQERASRARNYSPAQEQARKAAVSAMRKKKLGMFAKLGEMMDNIAEQLQQTVAGTPEDMVTVGKRKRPVRWNQPTPAPANSGDYFMVPPERALVPVSVRAEY